MRKWSFLTLGCLLGVLNPLTREPVEATSLGGPSHIGTFEGGTTFTTSSSNGINPGLYLEVMDEYGNYHEYTSEDGVITIPDTQEGAYVTQAKLLGKTKYRDQDTGELLDQWEDGRNLTLESVQMPVLTTTGKNLVSNMLPLNSNGGNITTTTVVDSSSTIATLIEVGGNITLTVSKENAGSRFRYFMYRENPVKGVTMSIGGQYVDNRNTVTFTTQPDTKYLLVVWCGDKNIDYPINPQIEYGNQVTPYEPYKSNILSISDDIELRGVGDVKDELDLITGKVTERVLEYSITGDEGWTKHSTTNTFFTMDGIVKYSDNKRNVISDKFYGRYVPSNTWLSNMEICVFGSKIGIGFDGTLEELIEYLKLNKTRIFYVDEEESIKTVALNSTYHFKPVDTREILVEGSILPLICSVTTPTTPLSFVLNPNAEEGQRFIAPEFTIRNQTPSAVSVELKQFTQTSNVLNDVLPTKYENWNHLNKNESKDIALALVPLASDGWESLLEGPRYVKDNSNYRLGTIKAESSVDFTFEALHGRAFTEALDPQYRLVLVFDF